MSITALQVQNFGPVKDADIQFGDLTILLGMQGSGKSLFLEMLKLMVDRNHILKKLKQYNYIVNKYDSQNILEIYFGEGMGKIIRGETSVNLDGNQYDGKRLLQRIRTPNSKYNESTEMVFYIPAQRIISMDDGRSRNFMEFNTATPYVLRNFSETLRIFVQGALGNPDTLFPLKNRLKSDLRRSINDNIFHDAKVIIDQSSGQRKMKLEIGALRIPFMAWSAGQKEYLPLLLSFYCLSKIPNKVVKTDEFKIVIIEEPEMGLHPRGIVSVLLEILDLMAMGYQVVVSTHSSVFLEFVWAYNAIATKKDFKTFKSAMQDLLNVNEQSTVSDLLEKVYQKSLRTYLFTLAEGKNCFITKDISTLDPGSDDALISEWGGLAWFSGKAADVVCKYAEA